MATALWPGDKKLSQAETTKNRTDSSSTKLSTSNFNATTHRTNSILGACLLLILSATTIDCNEFNQRLTRQPASYAQSTRNQIQQQQHMNTPYSSRNSLNNNQQQPIDLSQDASVLSQSDYSPPLGRPSVYHSIIDQSSGAMTQSAYASPAVQTSTISSSGGDLHTAAGHHHGHHAHGKYYEYRAVPKPKTWKFGYKRGNHKHTISRHEHGKAGKHPHFKTKVKWHDKKSKGKGIHLWDYNHHDKKHYGHHG